MRIRIVLLLVLVLVGKVHSNPLLGKWKMDLVGIGDPYIIEFIDNSTYKLIDARTNQTQYRKYFIDEESKVIDLGTISDMELKVRYSLNMTEDAFSLFFSDEMINEQFLSSFDMGFNEKANEVSKEFVDGFKEGILTLLTTLPIAAGKKID